MWDETAMTRVSRRVSALGRAEARPRIVVAEDDPDMRALVADTLRRDAYDVMEVPNGGALLVRIGRQYRGEETIDLLVSDVRMPVVTGIAILRALRAAHSTMPVVLMSAFADAATRREAESLDAVLLDKPLHPSALRAEVRRLLAERGAS
jgi:DNA-binding response OmpR family regulator